MIFVYRVTAGQEKVVADVLYNKIKKTKLEVYSIAFIDALKGYMILEAENEVAARQAAMQIPHIKGVLGKTMTEEELSGMITAKSVGIQLNKGDIVELVSGPFKGEKAKVIKIDEGKEECTVELIEIAVPIPVTVKMGTVRVHMKAEDVNA